MKTFTVAIVQYNCSTSDQKLNAEIGVRFVREVSIGIVITGFTKGVKRPQNSAFIIDRNGDILLKYSKVHTPWQIHPVRTRDVPVLLAQ